MATQKIAKKSFFDQCAHVLFKNNQKIMIVFSIVILCALLYCGKALWMNYQNQKAQFYFGALIKEYNQAIQDKKNDWKSLQDRFEKGFVQHSHSSLVPYYKSYMVNILLQENKKDEALMVLSDMISDSKSSSMESLYSIERALIDLDSADGEQQKKGETALRALAEDTKNMFRDMAQFYLGRYYWSNNQTEAARAVWKSLVDQQVDEKAAPSPWASQVEEYLKTMIV